MQAFHIAGGFFTVWATREAINQLYSNKVKIFFKNENENLDKTCQE